jgi:hypothetical protein
VYPESPAEEKCYSAFEKMFTRKLTMKSRSRT